MLTILLSLNELLRQHSIVSGKRYCGADGTMVVYDDEFHSIFGHSCYCDVVTRPPSPPPPSTNSVHHFSLLN